jgi:predicted P-loop ATPase
MSGIKDHLFKEQQNGGGAYGGSTSSCLDAALSYATEPEWTVFPVPPGTKKSYKSKKHSNGVNWGATSDPEQIERDFKKWPKANVGIPTGTENGIFVIDADTIKGHGVDGIGNLQILIDANSPLPETRQAISPTGSKHYYFKYPEGVKVINSDSQLALGVDVRGEGGMVVAPPSVKPGVGIYEWISEADIADAPRWLIDRLVQLAKKEQSPKVGPDSGPQADLELVAKAMDAMPNNPQGYEAWKDMGIRIFAAGAPFEIFDKWSKKCSTKYDAAETKQAWQEITNSPPNRTGAGAIFKMANELAPGWRRSPHGTTTWRECGKGGIPIASMHNARVAITLLGITCSYDTFHNTMLVGFKGDIKHELQSLVGEVSDNVIIRLRQIISDQFDFDPKEQHARDAVISLALDHRFDPVCDLIDEAQAEWDGKKRLDRMAVDYFNCKDTKLNRAFVRKMMIALVHRARVPGCKFDNIVVLESLEGWNKSSAFSVLAGDDNFSDESILGARSREVQEQLAPIWIHESADLAGMKKAEVESVKAFASRTTDIARAAYGRFVKKQKRHSIEVGTTNSDEYLQSQTGNRRFWPLRLLEPIDLDKLRKDRLQLIGEAAKYESEGESVTLAEALWPAAAEAQENRRTKDPWEDLIDEMTYAGATISNGALAWNAVIHIVDVHPGQQELVATPDILDKILKIPAAQQTTGTAMRLSNVMKRLGWQRDGGNKITIDGKQVRGYYRQAGMAPVQTVTVLSEGEDTTVADQIKTAGFEVTSHREFYNPRKKLTNTQITLTKSSPPSLPPELLALIKNTPGGELSRDRADAWSKQYYDEWYSREGIFIHAFDGERRNNMARGVLYF